MSPDASQDDPLTRSLVSLLITIALGVVTSFGLFWVMQSLINEEATLGEAATMLSIDFVRLRRDTAPEAKKRKPPKREKPEQAPPPPEMDMAKAMPQGAVGDIVPMVDTGMELEKATSLSTGGAGSDRNPVPLVRVDPEYPPRARQRGITGWVVVEFTIGPIGTVQDAEVIDANPTYIFDKAALRAVRKWRYNPQIQDGQPVARPGVKVLLTFDPNA
jgi:protein TonB